MTMMHLQLAHLSPVVKVSLNLSATKTLAGQSAGRPAGACLIGISLHL